MENYRIEDVFTNKTLRDQQVRVAPEHTMGSFIERLLSDEALVAKGFHSVEFLQNDAEDLLLSFMGPPKENPDNIDWGLRNRYLVGLGTMTGRPYREYLVLCQLRALGFSAPKPLLLRELDDLKITVVSQPTGLSLRTITKGSGYGTHEDRQQAVRDAGAYLAELHALDPKKVLVGTDAFAAMFNDDGSTRSLHEVVVNRLQTRIEGIEAAAQSSYLLKTAWEGIRSDVLRYRDEIARRSKGFRNDVPVAVNHRTAPRYFTIGIGTGRVPLAGTAMLRNWSETDVADRLEDLLPHTHLRDGYRPEPKEWIDKEIFAGYGFDVNDFPSRRVFTVFLSRSLEQMTYQIPSRKINADASQLERGELVHRALSVGLERALGASQGMDR